MANITLGQLRDLWKNVSDWVTGAATHEPKVQLSGRKPQFITLTTTPLGSGTGDWDGPAQYESPWYDTADYDVTQVGLSIRCDHPVVALLMTSPNQNRETLAYALAVPISDNIDRYQLASQRGPYVIPPVTIHDRYWKVQVLHFGPDPMGLLEVRANVYHSEVVMASTIATTLINGLTLTDTNPVEFQTRGGNYAYHMYQLHGLAWGNSPKSVLVQNFHDVAVDFSLFFRRGLLTANGLVVPMNAPLIQAHEVPAGATLILTNDEYPGLDVSWFQMWARVQARAMPTSGHITALVTLDSNY